MLCFFSLIFIFVIVAQIESGDISTWQAFFYGTYGLIMFNETSKPYWSCKTGKRTKKE